MRHLPLLFLLGALLPAGCGASGPQAPRTHEMQAWTCGEVKKLSGCEGVHLASQPSAEDLRALRDAGIRTVVNLRLPQEMDFDEEAVVRELGMDYVALPWNGPDQLTDEVFAQGRALLEQEERPLLLHCASSNRVGPLWIAWRVLDGGVPLEQAEREAAAAGMRSAAYAEKARDYVARQGGAAAAR